MQLMSDKQGDNWKRESLNIDLILIETQSVIIDHRLHHNHDFCWEDIKILDNKRN